MRRGVHAGAAASEAPLRHQRRRRRAAAEAAVARQSRRSAGPVLPEPGVAAGVAGMTSDCSPVTTLFATFRTSGRRRDSDSIDSSEKMDNPFISRVNVLVAFEFSDDTNNANNLMIVEL